MGTSYRRYLLAQEWKLALMLPAFGMLLWLLPYLVDQARAIPDGAAATSAKITSITLAMGRRETKMIVEAQSSDGLAATMAVPIAQVAGCKPGDAIKARRKGVILYISPEPCQ